MKNISGKILEKIQTYILLSTTSPPPQSCPLLYRVIKKSLCNRRLYCNRQVHREFLITLYNVVKYGRSGQAIDNSTIWRTRFPWCINKAKNIHSEYAYPRQKCLRERASMLFVRTLPALLTSCTRFETF